MIHASGGLVFLIYFVALTALSLARRTPFGGRAIFLLRAFFPSWRFFEDIGDAPGLVLRVRKNTADGYDEWQPVLTKIQRRWGHLILNPVGNRLLACGSAIQLLLSDIEDLPEASDPRELEKGVSYGVVRDLIRVRARELNNGQLPLSYQFKLLSGCDEVLLSPEYGD